MANAIKAVDPLTEGTPQDALDKQLADFNRQKAALLAQIAELNKANVGIREAAEKRAESVRFDAFKVRQQMIPLEQEYDRLSEQYTDIIGSPGVNDDGSRKLAKIKFSADEVKAFTARFQAEQKRAK